MNKRTTDHKQMEQLSTKATWTKLAQVKVPHPSSLKLTPQGYV